MKHLLISAGTLGIIALAGFFAQTGTAEAYSYYNYGYSQPYYQPYVYYTQPYHPGHYYYRPYTNYGYTYNYHRPYTTPYYGSYHVHTRYCNHRW